MIQWPMFDKAYNDQEASSIEHVFEFLSTFLNTDPRCETIRLYIDSTPGTGHQSASLHLLRRLTAPPDSAYRGFGFAKTVEIFYAEAEQIGAPKQSGEEDDDDPQEKHKRLNFLLSELPELHGASQGHLYKATINLLDSTLFPPTTDVFLGFTCGLDELPKTNLLTTLRVQHFLRLQPFGWQAPDEILSQGAPKPIDLYEIPFLGNEVFKEQAYFYPKPEITMQQWQSYFTHSDKHLSRKAQIVHWLTEEHQLQNFSLCPTYSIRNPSASGGPVCPMGDPARDRIVQIIAAFRRMLTQQTGASKPIVIINFDDYVPTDDDSFDSLRELIQGNPTLEESQVIKSQVPGQPLSPGKPKFLIEGQTLRAEIFAQSSHVPCFFLNNPTLENIRAQISSFPPNGKAILFIQLNRIPAPLYAHFISKAQLPAIFEGQNNANLALVLGKPYLSVKNRYYEATIVRYPAQTKGLESADEVAGICENVASKIQKDLTLWADAANSPTVILSNFLLSMQRDGHIHDYFSFFGEYYQHPYNDKFNLAMVYLARHLNLLPH